MAFRIGYVTDVEGNLGYWSRFCRRSEVIDDSRGLDDLALVDASCQHLVVGGDSVDKGPGDLRFLSSLLNLKAILEAGGSSLDGLISIADAAMYVAKRAGGDRVSVMPEDAALSGA